MAKEIYPSSYECDCGHLSHFFENTIREAKALSHKKRVLLGDSEPEEHTIVFEGGRMVDIVCFHDPQARSILIALQPERRRRRRRRRGKGAGDSPDFRAMARQLEDLGASGVFPAVHHFASGAFASAPPTLEQFVAYCEGVSNFQAGENPQTIRRGLAVCRHMRDAGRVGFAIAKAWDEFPLVTR